MKSKLTNRRISLSGIVSVFPRSFGIKSYLLCLWVLYCGSAAAQAPVLLSSQKYSAIGAGAAGVPTVNFNIPAGTNRLLVVSAVFERLHTSTIITNWPLGTTYSPFNPTISIGGVSAIQLDGYGMGQFESVVTGGLSLSSTYNYLRDADGLPTGNTAITFPNINLPLTAGDEMSVIVSVYENAASIATGQARFDNTSINPLYPFTAPVIPSGYTAADVLYLVGGAITHNVSLSISTPADWTMPATMNNQISNSGGTRNTAMAAHEPDGLTHVMGYRIGSATGNFQKSASSASMITTSSHLFAIYPPLPPAISGTVHKDITGPTTIEGAVTDAGGTYINVINTANNLVYSAVVNASGAFSVPGNLLTQGSSYRLEISKNTGTAGQLAPLKELNTGWATVGESTGVSPFTSDGTNDGTINVVATASPITGLRFGVNDCPATLSESVFTKMDALNSLKTDGSISISGLTPATVYTVSYRFDQVPQRALTFTPGATGTWTITGFTPGEYSHFSVLNTSTGCSSAAPVTFSININ